MFGKVAFSAPVESHVPIPPESPSLGIGADLFITLESRLYLGVTQSSTISIAQTYPSPQATTEYNTAPFEWRISPSLNYLSDRGIFASLDTEITASMNFFGIDNDTDAHRPSPLRPHDDPHWDLTEAYLRVLMGDLGFELGRTRNLFGLGIAANPGTEKWSNIDMTQWAHSPQQGDLLDRARIMYGTQGLSPTAHGLKISVGVESVYRDDRIDRNRGDRAEGYFLGGQLSSDQHSASFAGLRRTLTYREGGESNVWVLTGAFESEWILPKHSTRLFFEGEWNWLTGKSSLPEAVFFDGDYELSAVGGAMRAKAIHRKDQMGVEVGYASGDTNRYDNVQRTYQFDPNYRVGLILFPMLNAINSRVAIDNASDPNYRAQLPRGINRTATGGAVENALYFYPTYQHELSTNMRLGIGYVYAWRAAPHFDLFRSTLNGGVPTSPLGNTDTHALGQELNVGLSLRHKAFGMPATLFLVGAAAWPMDRLAGENQRIYASSARMELAW